MSSVPYSRSKNSNRDMTGTALIVFLALGVLLRSRPVLGAPAVIDGAIAPHERARRGQILLCMGCFAETKNPATPQPARQGVHQPKVIASSPPAPPS